MPRRAKTREVLRPPGQKPTTGRSPNPGSRTASRSGSRPARTTLPASPSTSSTPANTAAADRPAHRWTFLTNHAHVIILLKAQPELILREVASRVGITERAVQRIIQDLESAGFIQRQKVGRQNQYQVLTEQSLRHPIEAHRTIGDLLKLING